MPESKPDCNLIELKNIIKTYQSEAGDFMALKGINLKINKGEFVGVIGKSGSGKSTLINMITGIDHPTEGEVVINNQLIHELNESQMAQWRGKNIGIVFQFFQLLPNLSVLENVMIPMDFCHLYTPEERPVKAMELLKLVGVDEQANKMPSQLSGGQQQRVAIARALANDPPIIVADEPTGNLDSRTSEQVFNLFETLVKKGKTLIMVTHDTNLAKKVSRAIVISDGEVIEEYLGRTFPQLNEKLLVWMTSRIRMERFAPGAVVLNRNKPGDKFYIILKGAVDVWIDGGGGDELVVTTLSKGQYFGEIELLENKSNVATIRAGLGEGVEVAVLTKDDFEELISQSEDIKQELGKIAKARIKENVSKRKK